ncbi:pro-sigmaK processing inhibitor BofA family protein [Amphibacillus xylanus]|uniref:Sigma-K factor-processing regulatory protein BofA n=1 Tax=Amphibacillus xylanus (strain ATCC 51415 / DSM 6626 / JCM 7361 / LMG 17667 / NBRC 15112 / Ep01) TaxID=698758 RepID=K0IV38_AMPXN|nr:sigma-K factor-processing regulatory protein BofA [Amphibacillus xylanus NBRC 15112]
MKTLLTIVLIITILFILFNAKSLKWIPSALTRLVIGALVIFFLNLIGNNFGLHIPINIFTSITVGFCGLPGIIAIGSLFLFIL